MYKNDFFWTRYILYRDSELNYGNNTDMIGNLCGLQFRLIFSKSGVDP